MCFMLIYIQAQVSLSPLICMNLLVPFYLIRPQPVPY